MSRVFSERDVLPAPGDRGRLRRVTKGAGRNRA
jgi:hypothetical protein